MPSPQRQAAIRAAWAERAACEPDESGVEHPARPHVHAILRSARSGAMGRGSGSPDRLLPPGAEWACVRELRREAGGRARSARVAQFAAHASGLAHPRLRRARCRSSPEAELLAEALARDSSGCPRHRIASRCAHGLPSCARPAAEDRVRGSRGDLPAVARARHCAVSVRDPPAASSPGEGTAFSCRGGARTTSTNSNSSPQWCRDRLERDPECRLLIVDARLRQRRGLYERLLSQTLAPSRVARRIPRATRRPCSRSKAAGRSPNFRSSRTRC